MYKGFTAYLYKGTTVILDKKDVANANENDFTEVQVYLSGKFIKECAREMDMIFDDEDD